MMVLLVEGKGLRYLKVLGTKGPIIYDLLGDVEH